MYESVRNAILTFNRELEGATNWMYLDRKGLVTVGHGNLIDPVRLALKLPFTVGKGGPLATADQITFEWRTMKLNRHLAQAGAIVAKRLSKLWLSDDAVQALDLVTISANEKTIREFVPAFPGWPADAQLAVHSMSWAMGPAFFKEFPKFLHACLIQDWATAATECHINEPGDKCIERRNEANKKLLLAAQTVCDESLDYGTITGWNDSSSHSS